MPELSPLEQRLLQIKIKEFHCRGNSLPEALAMLTQLSLGDAPANSTGVPAVNLAAFGWGDKEAPSVNITLRDLSLGRMLEFVAEQVDYDVFSMDDVVVLKPKSEGVVPARLMTAFYPLTGPAFERLGLKGTPVENAEKLRRLFEDNGVVFEAVRGARLGLTANRLVVVQSARNHDRIARVLAEMK